METLQKIINTGIRTCLGLTNSTPITAVITEAGDLPINLKIDYFNYTYIAKQIYNNTTLGCKLRSNKCHGTAKETYTKYKDLLDKIPTKEPEESYEKTNIKINIGLHHLLQDKNTYNTTQLKQITTKYIKEHSSQDITYTDGSISKGKRGIGIYNNYKNETFSYNITEPLSIKSIETIAILEAIKIANYNIIKELTIITDSLSACTSINNYRSKTHTKHFERQIHKLSIKHKMDIQIIWIPSHIGIYGNDEADSAAKQGTNTRRILNTETPLEENINMMKNLMYEKWNSEFLNRTETKGIQHKKNIKGIVMKKTWFHKQNLDSGAIKRITRLRTNHTFDKKYLKLIKKAENDKCETCNTREDARHIIEECKKHDNIRVKFKLIMNKKIEEILADNKQEEYAELNTFLREIKADI